MPYFPQRRPLFTLVTEAATGVAVFFVPGLLLVGVVLPVAAFSIGVVLFLAGPQAFLDSMPGERVWIPFAGTIGVVFFAGLLLAIGERVASRGYVWKFEENVKCDERALRFVENLLVGKLRVAYSQLHESASERTKLSAFEAEWEGLDLPSDSKLLSIEPEVYFEERGDVPPIAPHRYGSKLRRILGVVDVACRIEEGGRIYLRNVRVDLVSEIDDWFVVGWQIGAVEED